jgi:hypothetical protein
MTTTGSKEADEPELLAQRERMVARRRRDLDRMLAQPLEMFPEPTAPGDADAAVLRAWDG